LERIVSHQSERVREPRERERSENPEHRERAFAGTPPKGKGEQNKESKTAMRKRDTSFVGSPGKRAVAKEGKGGRRKDCLTPSKENSTSGGVEHWRKRKGDHEREKETKKSSRLCYEWDALRKLKINQQRLAEVPVHGLIPRCSRWTIASGGMKERAWTFGSMKDGVDYVTTKKVKKQRAQQAVA